MSRLRGVDVDPEAGTATVQPGCLLADVDRETQRHGLATPLGFISEVGVAGLTRRADRLALRAGGGDPRRLPLTHDRGAPRAGRLARHPPRAAGPIRACGVAARAGLRHVGLLQRRARPQRRGPRADPGASRPCGGPAPAAALRPAPVLSGRHRAEGAALLLEDRVPLRSRRRPARTGPRTRRRVPDSRGADRLPAHRRIARRARGARRRRRQPRRSLRRRTQRRLGARGAPGRRLPPLGARRLAATPAVLDRARVHQLPDRRRGR